MTKIYTECIKCNSDNIVYAKNDETNEIMCWCTDCDNVDTISKFEYEIYGDEQVYY